VGLVSVARILYGATLGDYTIDALGRPVPFATFTVWSAISGGDRYMDLLDADGNATTVVTADGSGFVRVYAPDGVVTDLFAEDALGRRFVLRPIDLTDRVVQAATRRLLADPIHWDAQDWADGAIPTATQSGHGVVVGGIGGVLNGHLLAYGDGLALYFNVPSPAPVTHIRGRFKVDNNTSTTSGASSATVGAWNQVALNADIRSPCHLAVTRTQVAYQVVVGDPSVPGNVVTVAAYVFATPLEEGTQTEVLVEAWLNRATGRAKMFIDTGAERRMINVPQHDGIKQASSVAFWETVNGSPAYDRTFYQLAGGGADYVAEPYGGRHAI
jgi:hypothetical protein